jgi:hypothetical protein
MSFPLTKKPSESAFDEESASSADESSPSCADVSAPASLPPPPPPAASRRPICHIFVDASNISYSAKQIRDMYAAGVRVDVSKLAVLLDDDQCVVQRVVAGSSLTPVSVWQKWRLCDYTVHVMEATGDHREQDVDTALQTAIYDTINNPMCAAYRKAIPTPHTLVLATGDGKNDSGDKSFPALVRAALRAGWHVDLWCWESGMNPVYATIASTFPGKMRIRLLDDHRARITFSQKK